MFPHTGIGPIPKFELLIGGGIGRATGKATSRATSKATRRRVVLDALGEDTSTLANFSSFLGQDS